MHAHCEKQLTCGLKKAWKIWEIFTRTLESVKLGLWWDGFVQNRKGVTLKFTEALCVKTMNINAKFEEELTCHFKTDMKNLRNFDTSTQKSKKYCSLIGSFDESIKCLS